MISVTAVLVIAAWLLLSLGVLALRRTPEALCRGWIFGMLFLPQFSVDLPFLDLTRPVLLAMFTAGGIWLLDAQYRTTVKPSVWDLPVILLCVFGFLSSLSNGLGAYDGLHSASRLFFEWGLPYSIGRLAFSTPSSVLILLRSVVLGALCYVPFCTYEMRMAPVLHPFIYGYTPRGINDSVHAIRFGMWRPTVFMTHGLQLSLFMGISSVIAVWGAVTGRIRKVALLPSSVAACILGVTAVLCVSSAAILLTVTGWGVVLAGQFRFSRIALSVLLLMAIGYPIYRMTNVGAIRIEVSANEGNVGDRQASLRTRITSEDLFIEKWTARPCFGWTRRYFMRVGNGSAIPDSLWIIMLACHGLAGWLAWSLMMGTAVLHAIRMSGGQHGSRHPVVPFGLCVLLFWLDSLLNAFPTVLYGVMIGAASGGIRDERVRETIEYYRSGTNNRILRRALWPRSSPAIAIRASQSDGISAGRKPDST